MHDLPSQALLQQANSRPVSGEELEVFGKHAAARFLTGKVSSLGDSVVETVKQAGLSPEQVKRVVEFANTASYLQEFKKTGAAHRYIEFHGGPADPSEVLKDLNDGGGGTVFDRGMADYSAPPDGQKHAGAMSSLMASVRDAAVEMSKTASAEPTEPAELPKTASDNREEAFWSAFKVEAQEQLPFADPWRDVEAMREKLATTRDNLNSELGFLEGEFAGITDQLYGHVKEAAMSGVPLGHVVRAWSTITPGEGFVKAAFSFIGPKLVEEKVMNYETVGDSLIKTAGAEGPVNMEHPLVGTFAGFCSHLQKLAEVRAQRDECATEFNRIDGFVKKAASLGGLVQKSGGLAGFAQGGGLRGVASRASQAIGGVAQKAGELTFGQGTAANMVGKAGRAALPAAAIGGTALVGKEGYDQVKYKPGFQAGKNMLLSRMPYTHANQIREYQLQQNA